MDVVGTGIRHGLRRLRRARGFSIFSIVTLAVGIGATTAIYSVIQATLHQPLPFAEPERVMNIYGSDFVGRTAGWRYQLSLPDFEDLRAQQTAFSGVLAWGRIRATWSTAGQTVVTFGEAVTGNYFAVLGVGAALGRTLQAADDRADAPRVVVLSHDAWRRHFNSDPAVVGRTIKINDAAFEVAGVAASGFRGVDMPSILAGAGWITFTAAREIGVTRLPGDTSERDNTWVFAKGRLKPGVSMDAASAELATISARLDAEFPRARPGSRDPRPARYFTVFPSADLIVHESVHPVARGFSITAMIALALMLLVACTSLANLQLGRLSTRRGEIAVRIALGASRGRVLRELVIESVLLAAAGFGGGLLVADALMRVMTTGIEVVNGIVIDVTPRFEPVVLAMAAACAVLATVVAGLVPAWHVTRAELRSAVAGQSGQMSARWRGRRLVIGAQVAISAVLLLMASIFGNRAWSMIHRDLGVDYAPLAAAQFDFSATTVNENLIRERLSRVLDAVRKSPGVETAFLATNLPIGFPRPNAVVSTTVLPETDVRKGVWPELVAAGSDVFSALGFKLLSGRTLTERDQNAPDTSVVMSERLARQLFARPDPVGQVVRIRRNRSGADRNVLDRYDWQPATIVGVIADVDTSVPGNRDRGLLVVPVGRWTESRMIVTARMTGEARSATWLRDLVTRVDRDLPLVEVRTGASLLNTETMFVRVGSVLTASLGGVALLLGLVGLSGVLGHMVSSRTREIGIRIALGAESRRVLRLIVMDGIRPVAVGLVLGTAASLVIAQLLGAVVSRLGGVPIFALFLVPLVLIIAGLAACALPARRAARVDPNVALREL